MEKSYCPDCKKVTPLVEDHSAGDTICSNCGLVLENYSIDDSPPRGSVVEPRSSDDRGCYSFGRTSLMLRMGSHLATADPPTPKLLTMADSSPSRRTVTDPPDAPECGSEQSLNTAKKTHNAELQTKENFFQMLTESCSEFKATRSHIEEMLHTYESSTYTWKDEAVMTLKLQLGADDLKNGEMDKCEKLLQDGKNFLDTTGDINPYIYETYYKLALEYHMSCLKFSEVYMYSLLYLSCTSMDSLSETSKLAMAFDLVVSALIGDDIYVFAELLSQPIIQRLPGTPLEWLYSYVMAFSAGDKGRFEELSVHKDAMLWMPPLVTHGDQLLKKINMLSLKGLIDRRRSERTIQLKSIAEQLNVSLEEVKRLLIKSISVGLVQVKLNLAEGNLNVSAVDQGLVAGNALSLSESVNV